jgi:hypothetical protein
MARGTEGRKRYGDINRPTYWKNECRSAAQRSRAFNRLCESEMPLMKEKCQLAIQVCGIRSPRESSKSVIIREKN